MFSLPHPPGKLMKMSQTDQTYGRVRDLSDIQQINHVIRIQSITT